MRNSQIPRSRADGVFEIETDMDLSNYGNGNYLPVNSNIPVYPSNKDIFLSAL